MLLARRFIQHHSRRLGKTTRRISDDLAEFLNSEDGPGNVRELENLIERAVILADSDQLTAKYFGDVGDGSSARNASPDGPGGGTQALFEQKLSVEEYVQEFVKYHQNDYSETELARLLGIGRKALWARRRKWHMQRNNRTGQGRESNSHSGAPDG
jgi:DNA-binding NtrC family response regulator